MSTEQPAFEIIAAKYVSRSPPSIEGMPSKLYEFQILLLNLKTGGYANLTIGYNYYIVDISGKKRRCSVATYTFSNADLTELYTLRPVDENPRIMLPYAIYDDFKCPYFTISLLGPGIIDRNKADALIEIPQHMWCPFYSIKELTRDGVPVHLCKVKSFTNVPGQFQVERNETEFYTLDDEIITSRESGIAYGGNFNEIAYGGNLNGIAYGGNLNGNGNGNGNRPLQY